MMNYDDYNDYELISYAKENNEQAKNILIKKYEPLINKSVSRMNKHCKKNGLEKTDLIQEGMIALNHAIETFNQDKDTMFYTYAKKCIDTRLISTIIQANRYKNKILNESLSYDNEDNMLLRVLKSPLPQPEEVVINDNSYMIELLKKSLTSYEKEVFDLLLNGFEYREIADILNKDLKSIDNTIQRIKSKLKAIVKNKE